MKLYIPEIGDHIKLTQPWKFKLKAENRNIALGAYLGYYTYWSKLEIWINSNIIPRIREADYSVNYPEYPESKSFRLFGCNPLDEYNKKCREAEQNCPEYVQFEKDRLAWRDLCDSQEQKEFLDVELPEGTILAIDRIYIRKGASDFSSVTFYAKDLGMVEIPNSPYSRVKSKKIKKKALRFWVKLSEVNTLEFEPTEKIK